MKRRYLVYLILTLALIINLSCVSHFEQSYAYSDSIARLTSVDDKYTDLNKMLAYNIETDYIDNNDTCEFKEDHNTRKLSFVSENDLMEILNLIPGSVSPFGLLNDKECKVKFFLDKAFTVNKAIVGIHPNDNTATVFVKANDLIDIIKEHGNEVHVMN